MPVLVLGQGEMGRTGARALVAAGFPVTGWSRGPGAADPGVRASARRRRACGRPCREGRSVLVNLLPLTAADRGPAGCPAVCRAAAAAPAW
jgi:3-hydroxyisobutyrate dehydrogenase-like beta-hydroxyacid dehydrogenase